MSASEDKYFSNHKGFTSPLQELQHQEDHYEEDIAAKEVQTDSEISPAPSSATTSQTYLGIDNLNLSLNTRKKSVSFKDEVDSIDPAPNHYVDSPTYQQDDEQANTTQNESDSPEPLSRRSLVIVYMWLSTFAFFYYFNPADPFMMKYLVSEKQIPRETVVNEVFPVWSYAYPFVQLTVGILSEMRVLAHKWVVTVGLLAFIASQLLIVFCNNSDLYILLLLSEVIFAFSFAAHQAFFGLRYHLLPSTNYQFITAMTRGTMLFGHVLGASVGQGLQLLGVDLTYLFYLSVITTAPCLYIAIALFPSPDNYQNPLPPKRTIKTYFSEILQCYKHFDVIFWSVIVVFQVSIHQLALTYYQSLFDYYEPDKTYNGFVISAAYLLSAFASLMPRPQVVWKYGNFVVIPILVLIGACLFVMSTPSICNLYLAYVLFIIYHALFEFLSVAASATIATSMKVTRFAAIFSLNATVQNVFQSILQLIVGGKVLKLNAVKQYKLYSFITGGLIGLLVILNIARIAYLAIQKRKQENIQNSSDATTGSASAYTEVQDE